MKLKIIFIIVFLIAFILGFIFSKKLTRPEIIEKVVTQEVVVEKEVEKIIKKEIIKNDGTIEREEVITVERDKNTKKEQNAVVTKKAQRDYILAYGYRIKPTQEPEHIIQLSKRMFENVYVGIQASTNSEIAIMLGIEF
ncbi:MAG: hypothetical protein ABIM30_01070 [candidate division WOR-3 bacterium]